MLLGVFCTFIDKNCHPQKKYFLNLKLEEITNSNECANLFFLSLSFLGDKLTAASHQLFAVPWGCDGGGEPRPSLYPGCLQGAGGTHCSFISKARRPGLGSSLSPWSSRAADCSVQTWVRPTPGPVRP